jgi:hypothetical protein
MGGRRVRKEKGPIKLWGGKIRICHFKEGFEHEFKVTTVSLPQS